MRRNDCESYTVARYKSESHALSSLGEIVESLPDVVVLDRLLRWGVQQVANAESPATLPAGNPFDAGLRVFRSMRAFDGLADIPIVFHSVTSRPLPVDVAQDPQIYLAPKSGSYQELVDLIALIGARP